MSSKLKELLKASMCNVMAIQQAAQDLGTVLESKDADEATAAVNAAIIDALELPRAERTAAQAELAKACAEAREVAHFHLKTFGNVVTNKNRAGALGVTIAQARRRLIAAIDGAGESSALDANMYCRPGKRLAWTKAKATPKPWHEALGLLDAAEGKV